MPATAQYHAAGNAVSYRTRQCRRSDGTAANATSTTAGHAATSAGTPNAETAR